MRKILALMLLVTPAEAHSWYKDLVDPSSGLNCCGDDDCGPVDVSRVEETRDDFILDGKMHYKKVWSRPAQDGRYHACIVQEKIRCFFFPSNV